ncbi:CsbA family protein [Jeotgalibacillus aurantiacus]|uniref:CsbA family protein n=1 Tax=Jeotgalibacillus aurantiacus TaxID=2763266 RepID=UPI001D0A4894|nr:CsbA family protein [Jeotgalibacillus aurantiacus]
METKILLAMVAPAILVILFTRVTYSRTIAMILTVALIAASSYKGYVETWYVVIIDAASLTVGLWYVNRYMKKYNEKQRGAV